MRLPRPIQNVVDLLLSDLRGIKDAIRVLHIDNQQQIETINTARERKQQEESIQPAWMKDALAKYQEIERNRATNDDRHYRTQRAIMWATWCTFFAAAFYGAVAYRQMKEMVAATRAAQQAVQESRLNRQQSVRTLDATIRQFQLDQRAWLGVSEVNGEAIVGQPANFRATIKNSGKTPALHVFVTSILQWVPKGKNPDFSRGGTPSPKVIIQPNGIMYNDKTATQGMPLRQEFYSALEAGEGRIYIFGVIHYDDIWGYKHWTKYCVSLDFPTKSFPACDSFNDVDKEQR